MLLDDSLQSLYEAAKVVPVYTRHQDEKDMSGFQIGCYDCPHGKNNFGIQSVYDTIYGVAYDDDENGSFSFGFTVNMSDRIWMSNNDYLMARDYLKRIRNTGTFFDGQDIREDVGTTEFPVRLLSVDGGEPYHAGTVNLWELLQENMDVVVEVELRRFRSIASGHYWAPDAGMFDAYRVAQGRNLNVNQIAHVMRVKDEQYFEAIVNYFGVRKEKLSLKILRDDVQRQPDAMDMARARVGRGLR